MRVGVGVGREVEHLALLDGRPHREHHVGEHDAGHQVDAVALEQALGELLADLGVERVVGEHHLGRQAAELAAGQLQRQVEAVADLDADGAGGAGQRGQEADLQLVGGVRIQQHRTRLQQPGLFFMGCSSSICILRPIQWIWRW